MAENERQLDVPPTRLGMVDGSPNLPISRSLMMAYDKITPRARQRMRHVLKLRKEGKTFFELGRELKVTRERVRQIEKLGLHLRELGKL